VKVFWKRMGDDPYVVATRDAHAIDSKISSDNIRVAVGDDGQIFFYPAEYSITGFSLFLEDLETVAHEARARKNN